MLVSPMQQIDGHDIGLKIESLVAFDADDEQQRPEMDQVCCPFSLTTKILTAPYILTGAYLSPSLSSSY